MWQGMFRQAALRAGLVRKHVQVGGKWVPTEGESGRGGGEDQGGVGQLPWVTGDEADKLVAQHTDDRRALHGVAERLADKIPNDAEKAEARKLLEQGQSLMDRMVSEARPLVDALKPIHAAGKAATREAAVLRREGELTVQENKKIKALQDDVHLWSKPSGLLSWAPVDVKNAASGYAQSAAAVRAEIDAGKPLKSLRYLFSDTSDPGRPAELTVALEWLKAINRPAMEGQVKRLNDAVASVRARAAKK